MAKFVQGALPVILTESCMVGVQLLLFLVEELEVKRA